jgi:hypothetical protein
MQELDLAAVVEAKARELVASVDNPTENGVTLAEKAKQVVDATAIAAAIQDEQLQDELKARKTTEILARADAETKGEQAKSRTADIALQEADFGVYSGVANYAGIKKPLPKKMQNVLFFILGIVQTFFLVLIGVPISIFNMLVDGLDSIVKKLASISKSAMWISLVALIGIAIMVLIAFVKFSLQNFGII